MKSLAVYLKEYKKESILAPLFKLLEVVFDLLVPVVVAQIIMSVSHRITEVMWFRCFLY